MSRERGGIIIGWFVKLIIGLTLVGILTFEAGAVVVAMVGADNAARVAAQDGVAEFTRTHKVDGARKDAEAAAAREGGRLVDFKAGTGSGQDFATATVEKEAKTIFIHRIGFLKRFTRQRSDSTAYFT